MAVYQVLLVTSPYRMPRCEAYLPLRRLLYPSVALDVYDLKIRRARVSLRVAAQLLHNASVRIKSFQQRFVFYLQNRRNTEWTRRDSNS